MALVATFLRVTVAMIIALTWTLPVGVAIGSSVTLARWLQPVVQIAASVPATALFPAFLLIFLNLPNGLNITAVILMLMGTQWYLLFNISAGASAIPQDLKHTAALLHLKPAARWQTLTLPALFPHIITGLQQPSEGRVLYRNQTLRGVNPYASLHSVGRPCLRTSGRPDTS